MAGPIYRHDPANPSPTKFPAYWDGKAFFGEYSQDYIAAFTLTKPNGPITKIENFFPNLELGSRGYRAVGRPDRPGVRSRRLALRPELHHAQPGPGRLQPGQPAPARRRSRSIAARAVPRR